MTATSRAATVTAASASTAAARTVAAKHYCLNSQILSKNYEYRKVASRSTCYYSGNRVFGGATN